jgi:hypothetical protein
MIIDLTPLVQALAALALASLSAATPYFVPLLVRYLHIRLTSIQASAIQNAADVGAQAAYGYIATNAANYHDVTIRNAALAKGVQHVMDSTPDALTALGITPDHVKQMVEARFGGLLAGDPNVSITTPPPAAA